MNSQSAYTKPQAIRDQKWVLFVFLCLLALAVFTGCTRKSEDNTVKMGFTPAESSEKVNANGQVLAKILEKKVGRPFKVYVASDYTALVEAMRSGQVDVAWLAPFAFVIAEKKAGARVALKSVRHGQASQYSAIIVKKDSPYKTIEDLKGKNMAWTDPSSSSGHIAPKSALLAKGIDVDNFFGKQTWAGSHESAVLAVANGSVDAAATFSDNAEGSSGSWTKYARSGNGTVELRPLFVTPPMPSDTVSLSAKFYEKDPAFAAQLTDIIEATSKEPEGAQALKDLYAIEGLVKADSAEYEPLRIAATKLGYELGSKQAQSNAPAETTKK